MSTTLPANPVVFTRKPLRFRRMIYTLLDKLNCPGVVRDFTFHDHVTDQRLEIEVGLFLTRISINGRDYYFERLSGKFDGTGMRVG